MLITHDTRCALDAVVDLVNTAPEDDTADGLANVAGPARFRTKRTTSAMSARCPSATSRPCARSAAGSPGSSRPPIPRAAAALINELVAAAGTTPRLTDHDGYDWHVHYFAPGASVADHLAADCGMALAFFVVAGEQERLRRCEAPDCRRAFVDLSRNRSRRYCDSRTCGNRLHVAAYRARRKEAAGCTASRASAGDARDSAYGSEQQQIVQRSHEQQTADHRKEDHQRWLGEREETTTRLLGTGRRCRSVLCPASRGR